MKLNSILSAGLFAAITTLSLGAFAATEADKPAEAKAPPAEAKAPAADAKAEKVVAKKSKKHSHMEERTGSPQREPEANLDKPNAATDMTKHYHPRDAK